MKDFSLFITPWFCSFRLWHFISHLLNLLTYLYIFTVCGVDTVCGYRVPQTLTLPRCTSTCVPCVTTEWRWLRKEVLTVSVWWSLARYHFSSLCLPAASQSLTYVYLQLLNHSSLYLQHLTHSSLPAASESLISTFSTSVTHSSLPAASESLISLPAASQSLISTCSMWITHLYLQPLWYNCVFRQCVWVCFILFVDCWATQGVRPVKTLPQQFTRVCFWGPALLGVT